MDLIQETLMGLLGFGLSFVVLFIIYRAVQLTNQLKLNLIEKGMDPSLAHAKPPRKQNNLKIGLLLIGVALGVLAGYLINLTLGLPDFVAYSSMILLFCGGLLVYLHKSSID